MRPQREFDWVEIADWFKVQCPADEVAAMLACDLRTLSKASWRANGMDIRAFEQKWQAVGKSIIRKLMFERASERSKDQAGMLKYLDKKLLGGLPADQQPQAPAQIGSQVFIQNNPQALPPGQNVVDLLATILGKRSEPKLIEAK